MLSLPNFFLVGAPKAGTTALFTYLRQHPEIFTCPVQAPSYFADEVRPKNFDRQLRQFFDRKQRQLAGWLAGPKNSGFASAVIDWDTYLALFQDVRNQKAIGETSPIYLWSETAPRNLARTFPDARILMVLRNPADRAFSEYLNYLTVGAVRHGFSEQIRRSLAYQGREMGTNYPFLEFGLYSRQVERYLECFPRDRVHILFYEDYQSHPRESLMNVLAFLGVDAGFPIDQTRKHNQPRVPRLRTAGYYLKQTGIWHTARRILPEPVARALKPLALAERKSLAMEKKDREALVEYYREDIGRLAALLDRDLEAWLR